MRSAHLLCFLLLTVCPQAMGQANTISGRVLDAETLSPLLGVNVFLAGTTLGAATGNGGTFTIHVPDIEQIDLVASMVGYEIWKQSYRPAPSDPISITLVPSLITLDRLQVVAEQDRAWKRELDRFQKLIFNDTPFGKKCKILNPEVLDFRRDTETGKLVGSAREPLHILNEALGYQITFHDVRMEGNESEVMWDGQPQFVERVAESERIKKRWSENRSKAYRGSMRHFLQSLFSGSLKSAGFEAFYVSDLWDESQSRYAEVFEMQIAEVNWDSSKVATAPMLFPSDTPETRHLSFGGVLQVRYNREDEPWGYHQSMVQRRFRPFQSDSKKHQISWLVLPGPYTVIDSYGRQFNENAIWRYGFLSWERVGEMLPADYTPDDL